MKTRHQVCTFEQAKILKDEFGLKLESHFVWTINRKHYSRWFKDSKHRGYYQIEEKDYLSDRCWKDVVVMPDFYPAPSCAELGVLLPFGNDYSRVYRDISQWVAQRSEKIEFDTIWNDLSRKDTEAEVKTDLLIHLLKEKIINPEDLTLEDK